MSAEPPNKAKQFFDQMDQDSNLRAKIKLGLESLAKIAAEFDVTEEELEAELRRRWSDYAPGTMYSEPPSF